MVAIITTSAGVDFRRDAPCSGTLPTALPAVPPALPFDRTALLAILGFDRQAYAEVLGAFLEDAQNTMRALGSSLRGRERTRAGFLAHKIKSSFGSVFARPEARDAAQLERLLESLAWDEADSLFDDLNARFEVLSQSLRVDLATTAPGTVHVKSSTAHGAER